MKKFILSLLALTFTLCGCAKTVEDTPESAPENSESSAVTEEVSEEETTVNQEDLPEWLRDGPKPTEREREIVSEEDFEYEVMDGGAVVTKTFPNFWAVYPLKKSVSTPLRLNTT